VNYALSTPLSRLLRPGLAVAVHGTADDLGTTLDPFNHTEQETLPVIDNPEDRRVTEVRALGRYAHELKLHRGTGRCRHFQPASGAYHPDPEPGQNR